MDEEEKNCGQQKARNKRRGCCWCTREKLQQQVVMSVERKERAFGYGLHCCWFSSSSSSSSSDDDDDDDEIDEEVEFSRGLLLRSLHGFARGFSAAVAEVHCTQTLH